MKYTIQILVGASWETVTPALDNVTFAQKYDEYYHDLRLSGSGDMIFYGADYDLIEGITDRIASIRVYQNGILFPDATIDLTQKNYIDYKRLSLKLQLTDKWTNFDDLADVEYNILEVEPVANTVTIIEDELEIETYVQPQQSGVYSSTNVDGNGMPLDAAALAPDSTWGLYTSLFTVIGTIPNYLRLDNTWKRYIGYGWYSGTTATPPTGFTAGQYIDDVEINGVTYPRYGKPVDLTSWTKTGAYPADPVTFQNDVDLEPDQFTYSRWRLVTDVIEFLVGKIDATIQFDSTGTSTDSFYFWKTTTGTTYKDQNTPFEFLGILVLSDAIPQDSGSEKTNGATKGMLSFNKLYTAFEQWGMRIVLEDRSGTIYFTFNHQTEISKTTTANPDLNNIKGLNTIVRKRNIEYSEPTYNRFHNNEITDNIDFIGADLEFNNINIEEIYQYGQDTIYWDINDIRTRKEEVYNETSINQFAIIAVTKQTVPITDYWVRKSPGQLTNLELNNNELSFADIARYWLVDLVDRIAIINGATLSLPNSRLEKRKNITIPVPIDESIYTDFVGSSDVDYFGNNAEITEYSAKANENTATLKLRYV